MAGRPISASYVAFSATRVLRTGAIVGQGVGTAAALCRKHACDPRDLARGATVTSSGAAPLAFAESANLYSLKLPCAQLFPVSTDKIDSVEILLASTRDTPVRATLALRPAEFVYDFRPTRWRRFTQGCHFCMRVTPEQRPYEAANVVRGTNRPDRWTNLFVSDPALGLPAWLELKLNGRRRFSVVQITFDTDINRHSRRPLFLYPDCVKRYDVLARMGVGWKRVAGETDNYMRRRVLIFEAVVSDAVRIEMHETNGARSARVYEVRIYDGERGLIRPRPRHPDPSPRPSDWFRGG
jgi:hypothetical protein